MKYFIIAGEASGDLHASNLMRAIKQRDEEAVFVGMGGDKMLSNGCRLLQHYRHMAFMGVIAVMTHIGEVVRNFRIVRKCLINEQPDVLILVDYPSFNLKVARFCKARLHYTKIVYYIPPKVWAWKTHRIHQIARLCDKVYGIFPFEPDFYAKYGYECTYVGNPTVDAIRDAESRMQNAECAMHNEQCEREKIIALLPGSRKSEVKNCLPKMLKAARIVNRKLGNNYQIVVAAAPGLGDWFYDSYLQGEKLTRDTYALLKTAQAAVVNSGTATLETALLGCPQTAVYRIVCSRWLGWLKPFIFKIPFFTLVNIIPQKEVIKELIAYHFTTREIVAELTRLLTDEAYKKNMLAEYEHIQSILGNQPAAQTAAQLITA